MVKAECGKTRENKETPCVPSHVCYVRDLQFKEGVNVSFVVISDGKLLTNFLLITKNLKCCLCHSFKVFPLIAFPISLRLFDVNKWEKEF